MRDAAELRELLYVEVHRTARLIGKPAVNNHANETTNIWNCRRCTRSAVHGQRIQRRHVRFETRFLSRSKIEIMHTKFACFRE